MSLVRTGFIPLPPGAKPGFDHADVYSPRRRMYVAHRGANRVDVLDCEARTFLRSLGGFPGVAGVLVDEDPLGRCPYVFCPTSGGAALYEDEG